MNNELYDRLFYEALRIRLVEEKIIELYPTDKIQSPVHLSIGQEAIAVGCATALKKDDLVYFNYRSHAFYLAKGGSLNEMMAELYGKIDGCGRGNAGSMHLLAPEVGIMQASAVVAASIPQAVGTALAFKKQKKDSIVVAVFGDGATEQGVFHESLNFAALHQVPVVFLCENNGLAVHSKNSARQSYNIPNLPKTYGIPSLTCEEGYDFMRVHEVFSNAVEKTRKSRTPVFVTMNTFRYKEHVGPGDDFEAGYRVKSELESWMKKDPLITDQSSVLKYTPTILKEIERAVSFAELSPAPGPKDLLAYVE